MTIRGLSVAPATLFQFRAPDRLPDDWIQLSGFDLILVDGASSGLDGGAQRVLRRYLAAGGSVCVFSADSLRAGPLASAIDGDRPREVASGVVGFGRFLRIGDDSSIALPGRLSSIWQQIMGCHRKLWSSIKIPDLWCFFRNSPRLRS